MEPVTAEDLPDNDVAYECAAKQFDFLDRVFDGITARAAAVMGWASLALAGAGYIQVRMDGHETARMVFVLAMMIPSIVSIILAALILRRSNISAWPESRAVLEDYGTMSPKEAKFRLTCDLLDAIESNEVVLDARGRLLKVALAFSFVVLLAIISSVLWGLFLPSRPAHVDTVLSTHGELSDEYGEKEPARTRTIDSSIDGSGPN
jgi:hypothetical protein